MVSNVRSESEPASSTPPESRFRNAQSESCDVGWTLEDIDEGWSTGNVNTNLSLTEPPGQAGSDLRDGDTQVFLTSVTTCPYPCTFPALLHPGKDGRFLLYVQAACIRTVRCHEIESGMNGKLK